MTATSNASRKSAERQRRKMAGETRVEVWLGKDTMRDLEKIMETRGYNREYAINMALYHYRATTT